MKLVIMIPAFNEEDILGETLKTLPSHIEGVDAIQVLVLDDGSTDLTAQIARKEGAEVISMVRHIGLARTFARGLTEALKVGADIIVNFDADGQYRAEDIPRLIAPILSGDGEMVLGDRQVATNPHFSPLKRLLQRFGSWTVRLASGIEMKDATTGFRAYSRKAAQHIMIFSTFTYTLETIIQAGIHGIKTVSIPVTTNPSVRPSRLYTSVPLYIVKAGMTMMRIFTLYRPLRVFTIIALLFLTAGTGLFGRFLYYFIIGQGHGHIQSVVLGAVFVIAGIQLGLIGLVADLISINRRLLEDIRWRQIRLEDEG